MSASRTRFRGLAPAAALVAIIAAGCMPAAGEPASSPVADRGSPTPAATRAATPGPATPAEPDTLRDSGTVAVGELDMYYEVHGAGDPIVLLHGAYTGIDISFGPLIPILAEDWTVIAVEQQGHGRTEDVDRPLSYEQMADDTASVLRDLGVERADIFGYSLGANTALQIAVRHPDLVDRLAVASAYVDPAGLYPGVLDGIAATSPEAFEGSGLREAYAAVAPDPDAWPVLIEKVKELDLSFEGWPPAMIEAIEAPTLVMIGDSDIVDPAHATRMFQLLGGGVPGDFTGLPDAQLAVLPGTTHVGVLAERTDWIVSMLQTFLAASPTPGS